MEKYQHSMRQIQKFSDLRIRNQMKIIRKSYDLDLKSQQDNKYSSFLKKYGQEHAEFAENLFRCQKKQIQKWQTLFQTAKKKEKQEVLWFENVEQMVVLLDSQRQQKLEQQNQKKKQEQSQRKKKQKQKQSQRKKKQWGILWDKVSALFATAGAAALASGNLGYSIGCFGFTLFVIFVSFCCLKK